MRQRPLLLKILQMYMHLVVATAIIGVQAVMDHAIINAMVVAELAIESVKQLVLTTVRVLAVAAVAVLAEVTATEVVMVV